MDSSPSVHFFQCRLPPCSSREQPLLRCPARPAVSALRKANWQSIPCASYIRPIACCLVEQLSTFISSFIIANLCIIARCAWQQQVACSCPASGAPTW